MSFFHPPIETLMKRILLPLAVFTLLFTTAGVDARSKPSRSGSGVAVAKPNGGGFAAGSEPTTGARGSVTRRGQVVSDGQGNVRGSSSASASGVNGGSASRAGKFQRNADGSFNRSGNASAVGANGGNGSSRGSLAGDGQGNVSGSRQTQLRGANGGSYNGQTSGATGSGITHTSNGTTANGIGYDASTTISQEGAEHSATCTSATGEIIPCRK